MWKERMQKAVLAFLIAVFIVVLAIWLHGMREDGVVPSSSDSRVGKAERIRTLVEQGNKAPDAAGKRRFYESAIAEYGDGYGIYGVDEQAAHALGELANFAARGAERITFLEELVSRFRNSRDGYAQRKVLWARVRLASMVGPETRLARHEEIIRLYKDDPGNYVRKPLETTVAGIVKIARGRPDGAKILARLADELRGSNAGDLADSFLATRAMMLEDGGEKLALWNRYLERIKRGQDVESADALVLHRALSDKARLEGRSIAAARFFAEWLAGAKSEDERFAALKMQLSYFYDRELIKEARAAIIAEFGATRDVEKAETVVRALNAGRYDMSVTADDLSLYDSLISRFAGAQDKAGVTAYLTALQGKAGASDDRAEQVALCDRILNAAVPSGDKVVERIREDAAQMKGRLLGDPAILSRYYAGRAESAASAPETARLLLQQAEAEPRRAEKEALLNGILGKYRDDPKCAETVAAALNARANASADREEARVRFRETVDFVTEAGAKKHSLFRHLEGACRKLVALAPDKAEKSAVYEELIGVFLANNKAGDAARIMLDKAEIVPGEDRLALYDRAVAASSGKDGDAHWLANALLVKAEAVGNSKEKIALYDRAIEAASSKTTMLSRISLLTQAVVGRAGVIGGDQAILDYIDTVLRKQPDSVEDVYLAAGLTRKIGDWRLRDAGYDRIFTRYGGSQSPEVNKACDRVRDEHAAKWFGWPAMVGNILNDRRNAAANPEAMKSMRARMDEREARMAELLRRLANEKTQEAKLAVLDAFIDTTAVRRPGDYKHLFDALFLKADIVAGNEAKARVYEEILDRSIGWRRAAGPMKSWRVATKAVAARVGLIEDPAERARYYDALLEQYGDTKDTRSRDFTARLRLGRNEVAPQAK